MTGEFGTSLADYQGTIPRLIDRAAERDPSGTWLRTDDLTLTFAETAARVGAVAAELAERGIQHGDLVMLTARTTPEYLLSWLALTALGAVTVPVNPASAVAELAGLVSQVRPTAVLTDRGIYSGVGQAGEGSGARPDWLGDGGGPVRAVIDVNDLGAGSPGRPLPAPPAAQGRPGRPAVPRPSHGTTRRAERG